MRTVSGMKNDLLIRAALGLMLLVAGLLLLWMTPAKAVEAFNQNNLVRVSEVYEVEGRTYFEAVPAWGQT